VQELAKADVLHKEEAEVIADAEARDDTEFAEMTMTPSPKRWFAEKLMADTPQREDFLPKSQMPVKPQVGPFYVSFRLSMNHKFWEHLFSTYIAKSLGIRDTSRDVAAENLQVKNKPYEIHPGSNMEQSLTWQYIYMGPSQTDTVDHVLRPVITTRKQAKAQSKAYWKDRSWWSSWDWDRWQRNDAWWGGAVDVAQATQKETDKIAWSACKETASKAAPDA
jgi:hypothetical protein